MDGIGLFHWTDSERDHTSNLTSSYTKDAQTGAVTEKALVKHRTAETKTAGDTGQGEYRNRSYQEVLFNPDPGDPNLPGTYDATSTTEWGVPYSPGEYGYGYGAYGYGYGDPVADPYGYEHSETYGVYGSYGDPGGAGYVNPLNGNQMREQAFQTADGFVSANTGSHLGGGIMSQNGGGGTVDENGDPVDDYGYGYGAYGYGYGYGTTGLTTEEVTVADALATQKAMQNELHFHNYEDASGANAPEINGPMTPEANATGGSLANGGMSVGAMGSGAAGTLGMGLASGEISEREYDYEADVQQFMEDYRGELWEESYRLIDERTELKRRRDKENDPEAIQQYDDRIDEINERLDIIAFELGVQFRDLMEFYYQRKAAQRKVNQTFRNFLARVGDPHVGMAMTELAVATFSSLTYRSAFGVPQMIDAMGGLHFPAMASGGMGHHFFPKSLLTGADAIPGFTDDVKNFVWGYTSGELIEHGAKDHKELNKHIREIFEEAIDQGKIDPAKVTPSQMRNYIDNIANGLDPFTGKRDKLLSTYISKHITPQLKAGQQLFRFSGSDQEIMDQGLKWRKKAADDKVKQLLEQYNTLLGTDASPEDLQKHRDKIKAATKEADSVTQQARVISSRIRESKYLKRAKNILNVGGKIGARTIPVATGILSVISYADNVQAYGPINGSIASNPFFGEAYALALDYRIMRQTTKMRLEQSERSDLLDAELKRSRIRGIAGSFLSRISEQYRLSRKNMNLDEEVGAALRALIIGIDNSFHLDDKGIWKADKDSLADAFSAFEKELEEMGFVHYVPTYRVINPEDPDDHFYVGQDEVWEYHFDGWIVEEVGY